MSRIILNQIALQKIKVISETKKYFLLQPSSATAPSTSNYGITPPTYTQTGYSGWSDTEPSYTVGDERVLYELTETIYSDRTWDYSTPTISSSYKAAKEAYNEAIQAEEDIQDFVDLGLKQGYIWDNPTSKPASGTIPAYPVGSYIASGILSGGTRSINRSNSNTYGLNTWISTGGINLRYNAIDLMKLTTSNLFFYYPSTSTQQKKAISLGTNGAVNSLAFYGFNNDNKTMELTNNALTFYNPSNGTDPLATLNANGLVLSKGGITVDTVGSNDGMYISSEDLGSKVTSLDANKTNWRAVIGSKFGVDSEGNLYANEAHISGAIKATSGIIGNNAQNKIIIGDNTTNASIYSNSHSTLASTANGFYIGTDGLSIGSNFKVTTAGVLTASNLIVKSGSIADSVTIGGKNQSEYLNDNIEVGGRNLLYDSGTMPAVSSGNKGWRASGGTVSHIDISTPPIAGINGGIRCTNTGSSAARIGIAQDLLANRFIAGKKYSMGCWIRANAEFSSNVSIQPIWISSSQTTNSKYISMTLNTNWQYISVEGLVLGGDQASSYSAGYVYASDVPAGGYIEVCGIMLEEGTKCTSWTPAPEDVASDIEDASKVATNYLTFDETNGLDIGYTGKIEHTNIKGDGMRIYVTNENDSAELVASFLSNGSTIGKVADGESRTVTSNKGMRFYKRSGSNDITLAHIGYDQGVDEDGNTNIYAPYYTFGKRKNGSTIGNYSMAEGSGTTASGAYSHAEGNSTTASGNFSHAEGYGTTASGHRTHAEGHTTTASRFGSHAEGSSTTASGDSSHAEGYSTTASGNFSHAGGFHTVAGYTRQTVIGQYNSNKSNTAFEIGNGNDSGRSNALTVDWNGNIVAAGGLTLDGNKPLIRITEKGTEGHWRYRLWSDGRYEAWYNSGQATVTLTTSSGNGWYRNADAYIIASPSWASSVHYVTVQAMVSGYANIITSLSAANSSEIKYYVSHLGSLSKKPAYITAYITGAWM